MRYLDVPGATRTPWSVIGLGTWQFGSTEWGYGTGFEGEATRIVARARELGVTVFDTAELYGFGRSERILGEALRASGGTDDVVLATKFFPLLPLAPVLEQRAVASAARLGVSSIDLYQIHKPHPVLGDASAMRGMAALQRIGLVSEAGVSTYSQARWRAAEAALGAPVLSNQVEFSLLRREPAADLVPFAQEKGRVVIAYSPLAQGLLTARYDATNRPSNTVRRTAAWLPENLRALRPLHDVLRDVASGHDATPAQIALAWVVHHPNTVAIPGASSVAQLESNVAAAGIALAADEYAGLTAAAAAVRRTLGPRALPALARDLTGARASRCTA
ncbi:MULTISPECIES: aldo/keto reductase [Pseudonocardia]|uniref:General stress protein 69 n=2 Tax=Pseudonocardia TaxID=1847 RepID=A0A1Y2N017_PSEAH|nr:MULTISPECIES: aldo/keto reductase [Pseudonocardia]OSY40447.1 General stress protein 69 [Pseudonocardia autotrophica]TDN72224.1 aryl-alcohol dehydrogenase-like predicted oxidoreductase [Pseudonocardia autotrophica]BBG02933.1 putative oxidoreductase [Pseudonocardia autotrophica]GEC25165.1 putative oxidoreductase [Pseudonocardia saturnea]